MKLPKLLAIRKRGNTVVNAKPNCGGKPLSAPPLMEVIRGIRMKTMGMMKADISSRRRVNALRSLRIKAASTEEKPSFPNMPVLGA